MLPCGAPLLGPKIRSAYAFGFRGRLSMQNLQESMSLRNAEIRHRITVCIALLPGTIHLTVPWYTNRKAARHHIRPEHHLQARDIALGAV